MKLLSAVLILCLVSGLQAGIFDSFASAFQNIANSIQNIVNSAVNAATTIANSFGASINQVTGSNNGTVYTVDANGNPILFNLSSLPMLITGMDANFKADRDVFFMLYTSSNPTLGQKIANSTSSISGTNFNAVNPTRFIIHGWMNNYTSAVNTEITSAYLSRGNFNLVVVDWGVGAMDINFFASRFRVNPVSVVVASFINFLIANQLASYNSVAIIGHSYGAHVAGLTGKKIVGGKVKTIFGLDPSSTLFDPNNPVHRLASTDAQYVEVIHTNDVLGMIKNIGQADFYVNYGRIQPGCSIDVVCSHGRSHEYFAESIRNNTFVSNKCASYSEVAIKKCTVQTSGNLMGGEPASSGKNGIYVLTTKSVSPYGKG